MYDIHVFVCDNQRPPGHVRGCCADRGGAAFLNALKELCRKGTGKKKVRVNRSGCLDLCEKGAVVVVYPEGVWYQGVTVADAQKVYEEHILGGRIVESLRFNKGAT